MHLLLQVPQLLTSASVFVSQPLFGLPSQLLQPLLQTGAQVPELQVVLPCAFVHTVPQLPQLLTLLAVLVSQPFLSLPSQLPKPALQTGSQPPPEQLVVPFGLVHAELHAPQLATLVCRFVSQPLFWLPSQLANPPAHCGVHVPPTQLVLPLALLQTVPQAPQLLLLELVFVSQPLFGLPSQSAVPAVHDGEQAPFTQLVVPLVLVHLTLQPPQLLTLVSRFVSQPLMALPSQLANPPAHSGAQLPPEQLVVPFGLVQVVPHAPQLPMLDCVFVSQPLLALPSQLPKPALQVGTQLISEHWVEPLALVQPTPQPPQLVTLVSGVSQPLSALPSQLPKPGSQAILQVPVSQNELPLALLQTLPQLPQLTLSVKRSTSQPLDGVPSQSAQLAEQVLTLQKPAVQDQLATLLAAGSFWAHSRLMLATSSTAPSQSSSSALQVSCWLPGAIFGWQLDVPEAHLVRPSVQTPGSAVVHAMPSSALGSSMVPLQSLSFASQISTSGSTV